VLPDRDYDNDAYTPGVGYYHAPYHAWFPMRFDSHDPARGYFRGGLWLAARDASGITRSRPTADALAAARAAYQKQHPGSSGYRSSSSIHYGSGGYSSFGHGSTTYHSSGWDGSSSSHGSAGGSKSSGGGSSAGVSHGGFGSHGSSGSHSGGGSSSSS
jgi:hypothetical protein